MKNRNKLKAMRSMAGIVALVAIIALSMAACDNGGGGSSDPLNGTWRASYYGGTETLTFNNGTFTMTYPGVVGTQARGSYSTNGNQITVAINEIYLPSEIASFYGTSAGWKTRSQMAQLGVSNAELNSMFMSVTVTYSISGNTLTIEGETYTRQ